MSPALPVFVGPAVPRRNLITLFSWFRFCFLIKKNDPARLRPRGPKRRHFQTLCSASQELLGEGGGARVASAPGPGAGVAPRGSWRARPGAAAPSVFLRGQQDPKPQVSTGSRAFKCRWAQGGEDPQGPLLGQGWQIRDVSRPAPPSISPPSLPPPSLLPKPRKGGGWTPGTPPLSPPPPTLIPQRP